MILNEFKEGAFDFESSTLVEVVEIAGEEAQVFSKDGRLLLLLWIILVVINCRID